MAERFVRLRVRAPDRERAERAAAEVFSAGASGLEELQSGTQLLVYAPEEKGEAVRRAVLPLRVEGVEVGPLESVPPADWSQAWRAGLGPIEISPRLAIRPSFADPSRRVGQATVVIDPAQAFGTGTHATTRLALELLAELPVSGLAGGGVLDAGCGTGVLALAALRLGAGEAVAFDVDPLAAQATRDNARANGLGEDVKVFTGSVGALGGGAFDVVLANMLRRELEPVLPDLSERMAAKGVLILSGLLASERSRLVALLGSLGLQIDAERERTDETGDRWLAIRASRRAAGEQADSP